MGDGPAVALRVNLWARHDLTDEWFYTFDPQGNLSQKVSRTGAVTASALFDAQGGEALSSPQTNDPYAGFGGQWGGRTDWQASYPDSLVLCGHRFYDFNSGRFVTRDPLGYAGGLNLYAYCTNNPVNWADPSGLHDFDGLPDGGGASLDAVPGTIPPAVVDNLQAEENAEDCGAGDIMGGGGSQTTFYTRYSV